MLAAYVMCDIDLLTAGAYKESCLLAPHANAHQNTEEKKISESGDHRRSITSQQIKKREANLVTP